METLEIAVGEVGRIIETQEPKGKHEALWQLFLAKFGIDIKKSVAKDLGKSKLEESSSSSESDTFPINPKQEKMSSSDESLAQSSDNNKDKSVSHREVFTKAAKIKEKETYKAGGYALSFIDGDLLTIESNKGNTWIVCIRPKFFSCGGSKEVYEVAWLLSCKKDGSIVYKEKPNKYVLSLFREEKEKKVHKEKDKGKNEKKFIEEVAETYSFYPNTKKLFSIIEGEDKRQYGFLMPYLGRSLFDILVKNEYSIETRIEITFSLIKKVEELIFTKEMVQLDLKPANICVNEKDIYLIDLDSVISLNTEVDKVPTRTLGYLHKFIFDPDEHNRIDFLKKWHYQILQNISALVKTCFQLINGNYKEKDRGKIFPEGFYKQVEDHFLYFHSKKHLRGFQKEMKKIGDHFASLEKSEFNGVEPLVLRDNAINFAKEIFGSLYQNLEQLRYEIAVYFSDRILKLGEGKLKDLDYALIGAEEDNVNVKEFSYKIKENSNDANGKLKYLKQSLISINLHLSFVRGILNFTGQPIDEASQKLVLVKEYLSSVDNAFNILVEEFEGANSLLSNVGKCLNWLNENLDNVNENLLYLGKDVEQISESANMAKKLLDSIGNSNTEKEVLENKKKEMVLLKEELDTRQRKIDLQQKKLSEDKEKAKGWDDVVGSGKSELETFRHYASELQAQARELESRARELESQARELKSQDSDLESQDVQSECGVQGGKRKHTAGSPHFWSPPPFIKRVKGDDTAIRANKVNPIGI